jgi:hypothetical protein
MVSAYRKTLIRCLKVSAIILLLPLGMCVALPMGMTEIWGADLAKTYKAIEHPPHTERILFKYSTANQSNGDECDFTVFEVRSYQPEDKAKIAAFYSGKKLRINAYYDKWFGFKFSEDAEFTFKDSIEQKWLEQVKATYSESFYILYDSVGGRENSPPFIDWRCV